ncbi:hypothetical protein [Actinoplanes sp. CA-252034]|uniref:hypothetical protein n=1 Tax=Actinoplanes sp. CA-252034 TaxID=3239906 RepID=UPI003D992CDA
MSQHDPSAPGPWHSQGRPARSGHGEPVAWSSEVPEPASVPNDWSPSSAYAGHHSTGYLGEPAAAPVTWHDPGAAPGWSGRHPEPDPAASWNGNTTMGPAYRSSPMPDRIPAEWSQSPVPDSVPQSWHSEPPTAGWNAAPASSFSERTEPPVRAWNPDPAPIDLGVVSARTEGRGMSPDRTARRSPKLMMAAALAAAALAGGGVGAGLMAAFGGDSTVTVPAGPGAGQVPGGQPSKAST